MDSTQLPPPEENQTPLSPQDEAHTPFPPQDEGQTPPTSPDTLETTSPSSRGVGQGVSTDVARPASLEEAVSRQPSLFYRFFHWLLGKDSVVGRFMRPFLRILAALIGLISLGLLAGFFLLYQPTQARLDAAQADLARRDQTLLDLQGQGKTAQVAADAGRRQLTASAADLKTAQDRGQLLVVVNDIATARMHLALKDGARAMQALEKGKTDLAILLPGLSEKDPAAAGEIKSRLDLMSSVLVRDPALAQSDLDNLYTALIAIQDKLFK